MTPDVLELCLAGERALKNDEFEEATAWYELACAGTYLDPMKPSPPRDVAELVLHRFERYAELRKMLRWRSVQRLAVPDPGHVFALQATPARALHVSTVEQLRDGSRRYVVMLDDHMVGQAPTFFSILRWAVTQQPFTHLTLLEDDVVLAKNALEYIATTKIDDDLAFISWFSVGTCVVPRIPPVLVCEQARDYQFNQAVTFSARTVHELLESKALREWDEPHGADRIYEKVFPDKLVAVHFPNLVQHVGGAESLVGNNHHGLRTSPTFRGEDFDALTLIR